MTLDVLLIATGALGVLVAALSARSRRLPVSEPLLALVVGVLVGPEVLRALPLPRSPPSMRAFTTRHGSCW
jgi:NhaP-type Na+/H+ or K+/H+ antiporter